MHLSKRIDIEEVYNQHLERELKASLNTNGSTAGNLGYLQDIAVRIGLVQQLKKPSLSKPTILVFAGDNGIAEEAIGDGSPKFTHDAILDLLNGGAAINIFARRSGIDVKIIDAGISHSFEGTLVYWLHRGSRFFNRKIGYGTRSFLEYPAMTSAQVEMALRLGMEMVCREHRAGCNIIGLAALGAGKTINAAALCAALTDSEPDAFLPNSYCKSSAERESGKQILEKALRKHPKTHDPQTLLTLFGGFETAAMVGAVFAAAENRMTILIDGFVSAAAVLAAIKMKPEVRDYCMFCSGSEDAAHQKLLDELRAKPLLNLDLKSEEGNGIALAYPLVENAVALLE